MNKFVVFCVLAAFSQLSMAVDVTKVCKVTEVLVINNSTISPDHVHIKCALGVLDGANTIFYYALPNNSSVKDSAVATQLVNLGNTSLTTGKQLIVTFTAGDTSGTVYGCKSGDCRKPKIVRII